MQLNKQKKNETINEIYVICVHTHTQHEKQKTRSRLHYIELSILFQLICVFPCFFLFCVKFYSLFYFIGSAKRTYYTVYLHPHSYTHTHTHALITSPICSIVPRYFAIIRHTHTHIHTQTLVHTFILVPYVHAEPQLSPFYYLNRFYRGSALLIYGCSSIQHF